MEMSQQAFRAYTVANSFRPDDVKIVEQQLAWEEMHPLKEQTPIEFLEDVNRKFPLNELTVFQLLDVASKIGAPIAIRRCEQFLISTSRRSFEEKLELAEKFNLERLKTETVQHAEMFRRIILMQEQAQAGSSGTQQAPNAPSSFEAEEDLQKYVETLIKLQKEEEERANEVYIESCDNQKVYLGQKGTEECRQKLHRYLELARHTTSVPRYFSPVVLRSDEPGFVPPVFPIEIEDEVTVCDYEI